MEIRVQSKNIEKALRDLKKKIQVDGLMGELKKRRHYEKPSVKKKTKRIEAEKVRLVKEGQAKKEKPLAPIEADETPFSVPAPWAWARLQDITSYIQRGKSPIYATDEGLPVVSQKCVQWRGLDLSAARLITRQCRHEIWSHSTRQRICTAARNDDSRFA